MAALDPHVCAGCARKFGPKYGAMASRIRSDPGFKLKCYESLKTDMVRAEFVRTFGPVDGYGIYSGDIYHRSL